MERPSVWGPKLGTGGWPVNLIRIDRQTGVKDPEDRGLSVTPGPSALASELAPAPIGPWAGKGGVDGSSRQERTRNARDGAECQGLNPFSRQTIFGGAGRGPTPGVLDEVLVQVLIRPPHNKTHGMLISCFAT